MCRPMPVGKPTLVQLTIPLFEAGFLGYLWAKVEAPKDLYIGLLPIKYQGRSFCPGAGGDTDQGNNVALGPMGVRSGG